MYSLIDDVKGIRKLWIIGDNFVAGSVRNYFKKATWDSFIKENFHWEAFCSSRYSDKNTNLISRLQNTFALAINRSQRLPEYILVIIDDDIIDFANFKNIGVAGIYGPWCKWLVQTFTTMLEERRKMLPHKAQLSEATQIYWLAAVKHADFDELSNNLRETFNNVIDSVGKPHAQMRRIFVKEHWETETTSLVSNNRINHQGFIAYWKGIDAALRFNVIKKEEFTIRDNFRKLLEDISWKCPMRGKNAASRQTTEE